MDDPNIAATLAGAFIIVMCLTFIASVGFRGPQI
jgi:hypothetical protein